jgi:hypothetical protein
LYLVERKVHRDDACKITSLAKDKDELVELTQDYEKKLKDLQEDKNRRNKETMENLQTLLKEMTCMSMLIVWANHT